MFSINKCVFPALCLLISVTLYAGEGDQYHLTYTKETPGVVAVKATIKVEDSLLYMSANSSKSQWFPNYIQKLTVHDAKGKLVPVVFRDSMHWVMEKVLPGTELTLEYELHVDHEKKAWPGGIDGVAYTRDYGVMTSGRSLFVMNGQDKSAILVSAALPEGWKISTPWKEISGEDNTFKVAHLEELQESFLFAGTHEEIRAERDDFTLKFVLGGEKLVQQKEQITTLSNDLLDYYIKMMGGNPVPAPGNNLDQCLVIITENEQVDGEVIGSHISMFMNPDAAPQDQVIGWFIFAHEFFHFWNGKTLRFEGTTADWFKEGISNYYTLKGLYQVGFLNEQAFTGVLNGLFYQKYINDPGLGEKSPVASASGFSKDNHWGLIYGGGLFAGIAMDMEIRANSKNQKSLDGLMRELYKEYGGSEQLITNEVLLKKITGYGFAGFDAFFEDHLEGTAVISLKPYLEHAGMEVSEEGEQLQFTPAEEPTELQKEIWNGFLGELE